MSDSLILLMSVGVVWSCIGLALAVVMGRRGYNGFGWLVLGTVLGPLSLVLAYDAKSHDEHLRPLSVTTGGTASIDDGKVDVLVGYDGSPESTAAVDAAAQLFGDRLGRLTLSTVVPYGDLRMEERMAKERLKRLVGRPGGPLSNDVKTANNSSTNTC